MQFIVCNRLENLYKTCMYNKYCINKYLASVLKCKMNAAVTMNH